MKVEVKKLPKSEIELNITIPVQDFDKFRERAVLDLGKKLEIKGFRKGMAPKEIVEREIGPEKTLIETAELAIQENYKKAILENNIEAIAQPKIEIKKLARGNDFIFSAKTAVLPEIKLPDYRKIASGVPKKKVFVEEKEVATALKWLQRSRAKFTLKNQPAQINDFVEIEYSSAEEQKSEELSSLDRKDAFILGQGHFLPGFEENLIGMGAGEEKENIALKKDGKDISVKVKIKSVQNIELPEIGDEFAKGLGKFENLNGLKKNIKEGLILEKEQVESQRLRNEILEKISEATEYEIPEVLVEQEKKQLLENFQNWVKENLKISFEDYLKRVKKTEKEVLDYFLNQARQRVKNFLILREIGKREKIEVSEEEIRGLDPVRDSNGREKVTGEQISNGVDPEKSKEYNKEVLRTEKTFAVLEGLVEKS